MTSPLVPLLQRQFDTTLRLLISASHGMTTDEIMLVRIRLAEASLVLGDIIVGRSDSATNGEPHHPPAVQVATPQDVDTTSDNSSENRRTPVRPSTSRGATDRPALRRSSRRSTRSTVLHSVARHPHPSVRNRLTPLIEVGTDSDEE